jgi:A/G-specific adenine glycosylase
VIPPRAFRTALLKWYDKNKRALPWRESRDPYRVLVSELMLQQTQVKTVLPYYEKFLRKFPTAKKLAAAPEADVLAAWAGLGYYRRARFLQAAAKAVARGGFPQSAEGLKALPGIGDYTAAALGSISFGLALAVVDGNVIRVMARLLALPEQADAGKGLAKVREKASALLDPRRPGDFNQGLMELGALICSPRQPACAFCPVSKFCAAYAKGRPGDFPRLAKAAAATRVSKAVALVQKGGFVLCAPRSQGGRMIGLWHFPEAELGPMEDSGRAAARLALKALDGKAKALGKCGLIRHTVTRYRIEAQAFRFSSAARPKPPWRWMALDELRALPLASAEKRMLALLAPPPQAFGSKEMELPLILKP